MKKVILCVINTSLIASFTACTQKRQQDPAPNLASVSIAAVVPASGAIGTIVVLKGSNFSETVSENVVSFNGTPAPVTAATTHQITTSVPVGATSGKITVIVNGKTSSNTVDFTVAKAPVITVIYPSSGGPGTQVTIAGTNFSVTREDDLVRFNGTIAPVAASSSTQLSVYVPQGATSGKITVEVNGYQGISPSEYNITTDWIRKADFGGTTRVFAVSFAIGTKAYLGTGRNATSSTKYKDFWEYNPATDQWTQKADFGGTARSEAVGFAIDNKGYIGTSGGLSTTESKKDFWEYDPLTNQWTRKADFGGPGRFLAVGFAIGNKGYIGTGYAFIDNANGSYSQVPQKDFWEFDPATNTWSQKADFAGQARYQATSLAIGSKGYIGMGSTGINFSERYTRDFWEYDPATNQWTQKADFGGSGRNSVAAFSIGSQGYIAGGIDIDGYANDIGYRQDMWEYDQATNKWAKKADIPGGVRFSPTGFSVGSRGYVTLGSATNSALQKDLWEYTPR